MRSVIVLLIVVLAGCVSSRSAPPEEATSCYDPAYDIYYQQSDDIACLPNDVKLTKQDYERRRGAKAAEMERQVSMMNYCYDPTRDRYYNRSKPQPCDAADHPISYQQFARHLMTPDPRFLNPPPAPQ
jgi:hypothetical protein